MKKKLVKKQSGGKTLWQHIKEAIMPAPIRPKEPSNFEKMHSHPANINTVGTPLQKDLYNKYKDHLHVWQGLDSEGNPIDLNGDDPKPCVGLGCYEMVADYERSLNPNLDVKRLLKAGALPKIIEQSRNYNAYTNGEEKMRSFLNQNPDAAEGVVGELVNQRAATYLKKRNDKDIDKIKKYIKANPDKRFAFQMTRDNGSGHAGYITGIDKFKDKEVFVVTDSRGEQVGETKTYYDPSIAGELGNLQDMTIVELLDNAKPSAKKQSKDSSYVVQKGDSLSKIARKLNTTVDSLQRANNIKNVNQIKVNQKLKVAQMGVEIPEEEVLAESGEVLQLQDGTIAQVNKNAPTHESKEQIAEDGVEQVKKGDGGVRVKKVAKVLSDSQTKVNSGKREDNEKEQVVRIEKDEATALAQSVGFDLTFKSPISPAKLFMELQQARNTLTDKLLKQSELIDKSRLSQNSAKANMSQLAAIPTDEQLYDLVMEAQESNKEASGIDFEEEVKVQYGLPYTKHGLYEYPRQPVVVDTNGTGDITMENIPYNVDAYDADSGQYLTEMEPNQKYKFKAKNILEIPKMQSGGLVLRKTKVSDTFEGQDGKIYTLKNGKYYNTGYINEKGQKIAHAYKPVISTNIQVVDAPAYKNNYFDNSNAAPISGTYTPSFKEEPLETSTLPQSNPPKLKKKPTIKNNQGYSYTDDLGRFDNANVVPQGYTTSTGANSTWEGGEATYNEYMRQWGELIPNLSSLSPRDQQKAIYNYTLEHNPDMIDNMWSEYGATKAGGAMDRNNPNALNNFADGNWGRRTQYLDPSIANIQDAKLSPTVPKPPTPVKFEEVTLPSETPYASSEVKDSADLEDTLATLENRDYLSQAYSNAKFRNRVMLPPYFKDVRLKRNRLFQEDERPYLNQITSQFNAALQGVNTNSNTGQLYAAQLASSAAGQGNEITGQVRNRNRQAEIANESGNNAIDNQQAAMDDQNRYMYSEDWAKTIAAKDAADNQIDIGMANNRQVMQRDLNSLKLTGAVNPNFPISIDEKGNIIFKRKKTSNLSAPKVATKVAKYGFKKKKC